MQRLLVAIVLFVHVLALPSLSACPFLDSDFEPSFFMASNGTNCALCRKICREPSDAVTYQIRVKSIFHRYHAEQNRSRVDSRLDIAGLEDIYPLHTAMAPSGAVALWFTGELEAKRGKASRRDLGLVLLTPEGDLDTSLGEKGYFTLRHSMRAEQVIFVDDSNLVLFANNTLQNELAIFWLQKDAGTWKFRQDFGTKLKATINYHQFLRPDLFPEDLGSTPSVLETQLMHAAVNADGSLTVTGTVVIPEVNHLGAELETITSAPPKASFFFVATMSYEGHWKLRTFAKLSVNPADQVNMVVMPDFSRLLLLTEEQILTIEPTAFDDKGFATRLSGTPVDLRGNFIIGSPIAMDADSITFLARGSDKPETAKRIGFIGIDKGVGAHDRRPIRQALYKIMSLKSDNVVRRITLAPDLDDACENAVSLNFR